MSVSGVPLVVRNVSRGGIAIESSLFFTLGSVETFRFTTGTEADLGELRAEAVSCHRVSSAPGFMTGFVFLDADAPAVRAKIEALIDAASAPV